MSHIKDVEHSLGAVFCADCARKGNFAYFNAYLCVIFAASSLKWRLFADVGGVAVEGGEFGALYGGVAEEGGVSLLVHFEYVVDGEGESLGDGSKFGDFGGGGVDVVGAGFLAGVAAVEAVAEADSFGNIAAVFNGEAREAAACIDGAVVADCLGGAVDEAAAAADAWRDARFVGLQSGGGDYKPEEMVGAEGGDYELVVYSYEPQSCLLCPVSLAQRGCIDTDARRGTEGGEVIDNGCEAVAHHLVVVVAIGVVGDLWVLRLLFLARQVV